MHRSAIRSSRSWQWTEGEVKANSIHRLSLVKAYFKHISPEPEAAHLGDRNNLVSPLQIRKASILRLSSNQKKKELCPKLVQDLLLHLTTIIGHSSTRYPLRNADLIAVESKAQKVANKVVYLASRILRRNNNSLKHSFWSLLRATRTSGNESTAGASRARFVQSDYLTTTSILCLSLLARSG